MGQRVKTSADVTGYGKVCLKYSTMTDESILAKAQRPAILAVNPLFDVEHIRDTFRFKAVGFSFRDALQCIFCMDQDADLCPNGLKRESVAKLDIAKLRKPKEWGWRFLAFDFIMPNHQIVECYIVFTAMEAAKKSEDPDAAVCPELANHEIFELWRVEDTTKLQGNKLAKFNSHKAESNRRYDEAFESVKAHTGDAELRAFWEPFGVDSKSVRTKSKLHQNPTQASTPPTTNDNDNILGGGWNLFPAQVNDAAISMHETVNP